MTVPLESVAGYRVLFTMAAEPEYGPQLRRLFAPVLTGVGPVEAGVTTAAALSALAAAGNLPSLVVCLGSAGSATLEQTEVYQAISVGYRDMDATALGFAPGITPYRETPAVIPLPYQLPAIPGASLSTGASVVSGSAYDAIDADMVDMETYAVLRACMHFRVPLVGLRGISDGASELRRVDDWTELLHVVDRNLADALESLDSVTISGIVASAAALR